MDTANATTLLNDCVEVYVKMDTTSGETGTYIPGDFQFRMRRASVFPDRFDKGQMYADYISAGFRVAQVEGSGEYTQEWKMPWCLLADSSGMDPVWDKKQIKFDIETSDCTSDGQRTQQMFWNSGSDFQWNNTTYFGLVTLETPVNGGSDTRMSQTINFNAIPSKMIGSPDFSPIASASSGLAVYFTSSNSNVASIISNKIHITGTGTCNIIAHQDGNATYKPATSVTRSFTVAATDLEQALESARDSINLLKIELAQCKDGNMIYIEMQTVTNVYNLSGTNVKINMFPNPVTNQLVVTSDYKIVQYEVYTNHGKFKELKTVNATTAYIEVANYASGTYILKITTEKGTISNQFVVTRN